MSSFGPWFRVLSKLEYKTTYSVNKYITCIHRCRNSVCQGRGGWVPRSIFSYGTLLCELYNFEFFEGSEGLQLKSSTTTPPLPQIHFRIHVLLHFRLHKIRPLIDMTRGNFQKFYKPGKCQSIDEGMIRYMSWHFILALFLSAF